MIRRSIILIIVGMLAAAVLYDRVDRTPDPDVVAPAAPVLTPEILTPNLLATTWYCPMGVAAADHTVVVSNLSNEEAVGSIEMMTASGPGPELRFDLGPLATEFINLESALAPSEATGALIEVVGGDAVVGHQLAVAGRVVEGPCHSATSDTWYFAAGATSRGTREVIALLNPSYDDVVFRMEFEADGRTRQPSDLQAEVVAARSIRLVEIGDFVAREALVSTRIEAQGRLGVERLQIMDGALGPVGVALTLGVVEPATAWTFPAGRVHEGGNSRVIVTNPADAAAQVDLYLDPADVTDRVTYGLVPEELNLRPGQSVVVDVVDLAQRRGLPLPAELGLRAVSVNDVAVVAERWQLDPAIDESLIGAGGTNARRAQNDEGPEVDEVPVGETGEAVAQGEDLEALQPTPSVGVVMSRGTEQWSNRWVFPVLSLPTDGITSIVIVAEEAASVEIRALVGGVLQPPVRVDVDAEGRALVPIQSPAASATVVVTSDQPIVAEAMTVVPGLRTDVVSAVPTRQH